jgi:hypothetical protein
MGAEVGRVSMARGPVKGSGSFDLPGAGVRVVLWDPYRSLEGLARRQQRLSEAKKRAMSDIDTTLRIG